MNVIKKNQILNITKSFPKYSTFKIGIGWDLDKKVSGGDGIDRRQVIDVDAVAYMLVDDKLISADDVIFYNNTEHVSKALIYKSDIRAKDCDDDNDIFIVDFSKLESKYNKIIIALTIYKGKEKAQHFGIVNNAFARIVEIEKDRELCRFEANGDFTGARSLVFVEFTKTNDMWNMKGVARAFPDSGVVELASRYRKHD